MYTNNLSIYLKASCLLTINTCNHTNFAVPHEANFKRKEIVFDRLLPYGDLVKSSSGFVVFDTLQMEIEMKIIGDVTYPSR